MSMGMIWLVFIGIFVGTVVVGALLSRRGQSRERVPTWRGIEIAPDSPDAGIKHAEGVDDLAAYRELVRVGADLSQPVEVRFYSYFEERSAAERCSADLREEGFVLNMGEPSGENLEWVVIAQRVERVNPARLLADIDVIRKAATQAGGEFDGYEFAVDRSG